jgi:thioredoxin-dependent peroxiredoxin
MTHTHLINTKVPQVIFKTRVRDENVEGDNKFKWQDINSSDIFDDKKVVVFGLPGAFTPTCSSTHLPGYENKYEELKALGVDEIYCLSVNDAFVMFQWAKNLNISKVKMLPDGNAEFTKAMGLLVKKENLGFGDRSWRYSMIVDNGTITDIFVEAGFEDNHGEDPFEVSDVDTIINCLNNK